MTQLKMVSDDELIALIQQGDHAAFTEIYNRYWKTMFQAAYRVCRHHADSFDICQSLFVWLWENRQRIHITTSLRGYLHTAIKYKIANLIRNGKVRETLFGDLKEIDSRTFKANELEIKELKNLIAQVINDLPDRCREVFLLSRDEHLSHKQIAERLGIAEKTVDEQISRALRKLRVPLGRLVLIFQLF